MLYLSNNKKKLAVKQQKHKPILVLGAGSWGTALALLLERTGNDVRLWSYDSRQVELLNTLHENPAYLPGVPIPASIVISDNLEKLLDNNVRDVLIVVPPFAFLDTLLKLKKIVPHGLRIAWGTKGIDYTPVKTDKSEIYTFSDVQGGITPSAQTKFNFNVAVSAIINPTDDLNITDEATLDGLTNVELVYL